MKTSSTISFGVCCQQHRGLPALTADLSCSCYIKRVKLLIKQALGSFPLHMTLREKPTLLSLVPWSLSAVNENTRVFPSSLSETEVATVSTWSRSCWRAVSSAILRSVLSTTPSMVGTVHGIMPRLPTVCTSSLICASNIPCTYKAMRTRMSIAISKGITIFKVASTPEVGSIFVHGCRVPSWRCPSCWTSWCPWPTCTSNFTYIKRQRRGPVWGKTPTHRSSQKMAYSNFAWLSPFDLFQEQANLSK